ncbi:hypothetical protein ACN9MZ_28200 [Pseudoduganella sp. S-14]|uniref:hypothetical protein n=1 Tax=Pseudoduganella sp. S-14 TaxID=3404065 RepID=UPI003CF6A112
MDKIELFTERRADGKEIHEGMDLLKLIHSGWEPQKITHISWECDGRSFGLDYANGVLAKVLPGRCHIALIETVGGAGEEQGDLFVVDARGDKQYGISRHQVIEGKKRFGEFVWFEPAIESPEHCFGAVFQTNGPAGIEQYQFDFEISTGIITGIHMLR